MRSLNRLIVSSVAALLSACATIEQPSDSLMLGSFRFAYSIEHRESVQLVQAFDAAAQTYLQFTTAPNQALVVDGEGEPKTQVPHGDGPYLIVPGIYDRLTVSVAAHSTSIRRNAAAARAPNASFRDASPGSAAHSATAPATGAEPGAETVRMPVGTLKERILPLEMELTGNRIWAPRLISIPSIGSVRQ